ncbi:MAG: glycosyltransferase family 4 protein, partial [Candidatus Hadarchaeum sp.]
MRVLITTGIFPPDIGGPATYVPHIAHGLTRRGHEVIVLTLSDGIDVNDRGYPFQVIRIRRGIPKPWRQIRTLAAIWHLGREADVLFVNGLAFEAALANFVLRKPLVIKVVGDFAWERATTAGLTTDDFESFQQNRYGWRIEWLKAVRTFWIRRAHQVIVPSQYLARWVANWGVSKDRIFVIYNAVARVDGVEPSPVPLKTSFRAITVGRLVPWKRIDQLLEALSHLPEIGLVVIGDGPERSQLEALARKLGVSERVHFAGSLSKFETLRLMAACDLFVLNSTYEGLPHVVLEAMALGLPVVATAVGGTPEVVKDGETGILVPPEGDGLIEALRGLVEDPEGRKAMAYAGRDWVRQQFSMEKMVQETEG